MSEFDTYEGNVKRMLDRITTEVDKREGSIAFDSVAPTAMELYNFEILRLAAINETFADTATRKYLIKMCAERNITPKEATYTFVKGKFAPASLEVPIGSRYSCDEFNYAITEKLSSDDDFSYYKLKCETAGSSPNGQTGRLLPIDHVNGLKSAELVEVIVYGVDEESTESLRARYLESKKSEAFGGNLSDYKNELLAMDGVGLVKSYSGAKWNGGGTVKIVFTSTNYTEPSFDLVNEIQTKIDPEMNQGEGIGKAPVGHFVTVIGAYTTNIKVNMNLVYDDSSNWDLVKDEVKTVIGEYLNSLNKNWDKVKNIVVRLSQLESRVLDVTGVIDINSVTINGNAENYYVNEDSLVKLESVNGY